jgi:hypothetical protein
MATGEDDDDDNKDAGDSAMGNKVDDDYDSDVYGDER